MEAEKVIEREKEKSAELNGDEKLKLFVVVAKR